MKMNEPSEFPKNAKEAGLKMLRERAPRLVKFLESPPGTGMTTMPSTVIAREIVNLMNAAALYCPEQMGKALAEDRSKAVCMDQGFCCQCGASLGEPRTSIFCPKCNIEIGEMGSPHS